MSSKFKINLFKNDYKEKGDNKPIYSNSNFSVKETVTLEKGKSYQAGMRKSKDKNDKEYLSINIDDKFEGKDKQSTGGAKPVSESLPDFDDDIPY